MRGCRILKVQLKATIIVRRRKELLKKFIKGGDFKIAELFQEVLRSMLLVHLRYTAIPTLFSRLLSTVNFASNINI